MNTDLEPGIPNGLDEALRRLRKTAPPGFSTRVMANLPRTARPRWMSWLLPAAAGAAAAAAAMMVVWPGREHAQRPGGDIVTVRFELVAPAAQSVELVGTFNDWKTGSFVLQGPDKSGKWQIVVDLPAGRHEYQFLVDGREWITDTSAPWHKPDGFGHLNAVMEL